MSSFTGFNRRAVEFFVDLAADNTRQFWEAHKHLYQKEVRGPMDAFVTSLEDRFRPMRIYSPYRDTRFSADKTPYKTFIGAVGEQSGGTGHYVQISGDGLLVGAGYPVFAADQLERYRMAVHAEASGARLAEIVSAAGETGRAITGGHMPSLKTVPKGFPKDHPRQHLLKRKGLVLNIAAGVPSWFESTEALGRIQDLWRSFDPIGEWLDQHVGSSAIPPERRFQR